MMAIDMELWRKVQNIVYPNRWLPKETCGPKKRSASWLYYTLAESAKLQRKFFGST